VHMALFGAINKVDDCWRFYVEFDVGKFAHRPTMCRTGGAGRPLLGWRVVIAFDD